MSRRHRRGEWACGARSWPARSDGKWMGAVSASRDVGCRCRWMMSNARERMGDVGAGSVEAHYALEDLGERVFAALRDAGMDRGQLAPETLAPLDEFHIRGQEATEELAAL